MRKIPVLSLTCISVLLVSCISAKKSQIRNNSVESPSICTKSVRYTIEKIKIIEGGNEVKMHAEIIFNPTKKLISLKADDPEKGKISFDTEIESITSSPVADDDPKMLKSIICLQPEHEMRFMSTAGRNYSAFSLSSLHLHPR